MFFTAIILAVTSFSAHFAQEKHSSMFSTPQKSRGELTYRAPDYLRWEYTSPQTIVWELDGEQGNMSRQLKSLVMLIRQSISGDFLAVEKDFEVIQDGNDVTLIPKNRETKRLFTKIQITLNSKTQIADKVEMIEANGDKTVITFSDVSIL